MSHDDQVQGDERQARDEVINPGPNNRQADDAPSWAEQQVEQINPGNSSGGANSSREEAMNLGPGNFADEAERAREEAVDHQINLGPNL